MEVKMTEKAEQLARELASQAGTIDELSGVFRNLMKSALQRMLDTEMDVHLGRKEPLASLDSLCEPQPSQSSHHSPRNRRNGYSKKTVQGELGEIPLDIPRDRNGSFAPNSSANINVVCPALTTRS